MYQPIILKYNLRDFEPDISYKTFALHYNTLYLNYLKRLNTILKNNNFDFSYPLYEIYSHISDFPIADRDDILFNAGGVLNHEMYFRTMTPKYDKDIPEPLKSDLIKRYGSIDNFFLDFTIKANTLGGSGYVYLTLTPTKEFLIVKIPNQESPIFYNLYPLMNIDVWEHAYYLDYNTERKEYVNMFLKHIDFDEVNKNYMTALRTMKDVV